MTKKDREEFKAYLRQLTLKQVYGVLDKETEAGRQDYATLAYAELDARVLRWLRQE